MCDTWLKFSMRRIFLNSAWPIMGVHYNHRGSLLLTRFLAFFFVILLVGGYPSTAKAAITCTATMTSIAFGSVNVLPGTIISTTGTETITCSGATANTTYRFCTDITAGTHVSANQRQMASGSNRLAFDLYKDAAHTQPWGNYANNFLGGGSQNDFTSNASGNISATITVYATLAVQQAAIPGSYSEPLNSGASQRLHYGSLASGGNCSTGGSTANFSFTVTATATTSANVSVSSLAFGSSPSTIASNIDATATITVQSTNTTPYSIGLDNGNNVSGSQRRMRLGATFNYVNYGLFTDAARSNAWTTTTSTTSCTGGASTCALGTGTGSNQSVTIYGRVPPQSATAVGTYADSVIVTVTF